MAPRDRLRSRLRTAAALAALSWARLTVASMPFKWWRSTLGWSGETGPGPNVDMARCWARHVEWAARLLPITTKCLPRAMALSWILRARRVDHSIVFAVRPKRQRDDRDDLHAWIEVGGEKVIGNLPGPWIETLRVKGVAPRTG